MSPLEQTFKISSAQALIAVVGTLPGHFFTVALVDRIGRLKIQLLGFTMMTVFMLGLAVPYDHWATAKNGRAFFGTMCAFIFLFANFGPNSTTFIIPAEIFPARMRSTCHGVSGAGGKIGAIVGVFVSLYGAIRTGTSSDNRSRIKKLLYVLIVFNLVGLVFTLLLPESQRKSLEEITGEIEDEELPEDAAVAAATAEEVHTVPL